MTATAAVLPSADIANSPAEQHLAKGQEHYAAGRIDAAIAAFQAGLDAADADPAGRPIGTTADLNAKLGNAYMQRGRLDLATASYKAALRLVPELASCWCNLGNVHQQTGKPREAIAFYIEALKRNPAHWASRTNLVQALMATRQYIVAKAVLLELSGERPHDAAIWHQLGKTCFELDEVEAAIGHFEQAVALDPNDADSLYWIGGIRQRSGDLDAAKAAYAAAARIRPLIRRRAVKSPPDFRVLALYAPFGGNTPTEYLFKEAAYEVDTLALFDAGEPDLSALGEVDVVVNLISDADQAEAMLPPAARLAAAVGKPLVNDPGKIMRTTRDAVASLLPGIAGCRIPGIVRFDAGSDASAESLAASLPFSFPVLARPAGTHGGDDFEKIESLDALATFLAQRKDSDHYVIEYIDYGSRDGYFRKYRFIFVNGEVLPYHLAICDDWKVHHVKTDMANQAWMQREEAAFLDDPGGVFGPASYAALRTIRERIGLDYFGIDCALDASGKIVVFEVNASMLVHDDNAQFPYKDRSVRAIKAAFDAMLQQWAAKPAPTSDHSF